MNSIQQALSEALEHPITESRADRKSSTRRSKTRSALRSKEAASSMLGGILWAVGGVLVVLGLSRLFEKRAA
jgi:hypothetical protein